MVADHFYRRLNQWKARQHVNGMTTAGESHVIMSYKELENLPCLVVLAGELRAGLSFPRYGCVRICMYVCMHACMYVLLFSLRYLDFIKETVYRSLPQAKLGGRPGTYQLVRSFLTIRQTGRNPALEDGTVDGQPIWAMVFYCLRCGDLEDALSAVTKAG